jgi:hypothetical protein
MDKMRQLTRLKIVRRGKRAKPMGVGRKYQRV